MNLTHYTPNRLLGNLDEFLNQTLRSFGPAPATRAPGAYRYEEKDSYRLRLDLPGFTREEVSLSLEKRELTVTAKSEREDSFLSDFERTYTLPEDIDPNGINAKLENGVLDLTFKKLAGEGNGVRNIEIS
ncbi:Hsp20/alpha crystallin family protein [Akkermansiaceae bacterium]|nr:Hsp20/alpha crystallin family protein [Akkermansiaceae bacterium]